MTGASPQQRLRYQAGLCRCKANAYDDANATAMRRIEANLPHELKDAKTFLNFERRLGATEALEAAQEFSADLNADVLVLTGNVGSGKTHLLEAIGRWFFDQGRYVRYELAADMVDKFRAAHNNASDMDPYQLMDFYKFMPVLLIDDVGMERANDFATEKLTTLVEDAMTNGGRLVIATNLTQEQIKDHYGARLASRLWSARDSVKTVAITASDYRGG